MKNLIAKPRIICSTYPDYISEDDAIENLIENGIAETEKGLSQQQIWDEQDFLMNEDWECNYEQLKSYMEKYDCYLIFGSIGRWDGVNTGWEIYHDWDEMISWAMTDCQFEEFSDENGHLMLRGTHHDGSVSYEIKPLKPGIYSGWYSRWNFGNDKRSHQQIFKQLRDRYSIIPHYCHNEWGVKIREYEPTNKVTITNQLNREAKSFYC